MKLICFCMVWACPCHCERGCGHPSVPGGGVTGSTRPQRAYGKLLKLLQGLVALFGPRQTSTNKVSVLLLCLLASTCHQCPLYLDTLQQQGFSRLMVLQAGSSGVRSETVVVVEDGEGFHPRVVGTVQQFDLGRRDVGFPSGGLLAQQLSSGLMDDGWQSW